jgi:hypothetical protein
MRHATPHLWPQRRNHRDTLGPVCEAAPRPVSGSACPAERFDTLAAAQLALKLRRLAAQHTGTAARTAVPCDRCKGAHITRRTHRRAA